MSNETVPTACSSTGGACVDAASVDTLDAAASEVHLERL